MKSLLNFLRLTISRICLYKGKRLIFNTQQISKYKSVVAFVIFRRIPAVAEFVRKNDKTSWRENLCRPKHSLATQHLLWALDLFQRFFGQVLQLNDALFDLDDAFFDPGLAFSGLGLILYNYVKSQLDISINRLGIEKNVFQSLRVVRFKLLQRLALQEFQNKVTTCRVLNLLQMIFAFVRV